MMHAVRLNYKKRQVSCLLYDVDTVLFSDSAKRLQKVALKNLNNFFYKWNLSVNLSKANVMIFIKSGKVITR